MSTPSAQGSGSATSPPPPLQTDETQDTGSSVLAMGAPPGVTVQWLTNTPNIVFDQRMRDTRARSQSPRPRRAISPSSSVAQICAKTAEQKADAALSSTGQIADQTMRAQSVADDAIAEARAVGEEVESQISELVQRAEISTSSALGEVTGKFRRAVEQTQVQPSHTIGTVVQQLEKEIEVAASGATAMSESVTRMVVAEVRSNFEAQLDHTCAES